MTSAHFQQSTELPSGPEACLPPSHPFPPFLFMAELFKLPFKSMSFSLEILTCLWHLCMCACVCACPGCGHVLLHHSLPYAFDTESGTELGTHRAFSWASWLAGMPRDFPSPSPSVPPSHCGREEGWEGGGGYGFTLSCPASL